MRSCLATETQHRQLHGGGFTALQQEHQAGDTLTVTVVFVERADLCDCFDYSP